MEESLTQAEVAAVLGDRYQIVRRLGAGAFGAVYLAREIQLHRLVAIKVLHTERASNAAERERFLREARTVGQLSHPALVPLLAFGESAHAVYMVMPFVAGESLSRVLQETPRLDADSVRRILIEVCDAIAYAHAQGVLHRDIKPDNLLLEAPAPGDDAPPRVRIIDFGVAAFPTRDLGVGAATETWGTPRFMAPEQAFGEPELDPRSELYSIGVLGYLMLAGRLPFEGLSPAERLSQQRSGPIVPLSVAAAGAPQDLVSAIERCLRFEPEERWLRARELRDALIAGTAGATDASMPLLRARLRGRRRTRARAAFFNASAVRGFTFRGVGADVRFALRSLRKTAGLTLAVVLTLGVGIAATSSMFSLRDGLLRPPPVADASSLVELEERHDQGHSMEMGATAFSMERYRAYADAMRSVFTGLAAQTIQSFSMRSKESVAAVGGLVTSGNYFEVLGVRPAYGRFYDAHQDDPGGGEPVVVISEGLWQRLYHRAPDAIGSRLVLDSRVLTVIGVAPRGFHGAFGGLYVLDVWIPAATYRRPPAGRAARTTLDLGMTVFGRLRPGITIEQADAALTVAFPRIPMEDRASHVLDAWVEPLNRLTRDSRDLTSAFTKMLLGIAAVVLLIAATNVAGMLLARAATRGREMATRLAVGATRLRLVQQLLVESVLLSAAAGVAGLALTAGVTRLLNLIPSPYPWAMDVGIRVDVRVCLVTALAVLGASLVSGMAPALHATRVDLAIAMKAGGAQSTANRSRLRSTFVVVQLALSVAVLIVGGLFLRGVRRAVSIDPGFDPRGIAVGKVSLAAHGYDKTASAAFINELILRLQNRPEIARAAVATLAPLSGSQVTDDARPANQPDAKPIDTQFTPAGPGFMELLRVPLRAGRTIAAADDERASRVAVINETLARRLWPDRAPTDVIGLAFTLGDTRFAVIGVCGNGKYLALQDGDRPFAYIPFAQHFSSNPTVFVQWRAGLAPALRAMREELGAMNPNVVLDGAAALQTWVDKYISGQRVGALIVAAFGLVGLALAAAGIYAVLAFSVAQRGRELAVRIALGADRLDVVRLVLQQTLILVLAGIGLGLAAALAAGPVVSSGLFGLSPRDPVTFVLVPLILGITAFAASVVPARRATRCDPMVALRSE